MSALKLVEWSWWSPVVKHQNSVFINVYTTIQRTQVIKPPFMKTLFYAVLLENSFGSMNANGCPTMITTS